MHTYDKLAEELFAKAALLPQETQFWIGIAGGPGSGKSTLAAALKERLNELSAVIPQDGYHYYRSQLDQMPDSAMAHVRRGSPFTFDTEKFVNDLIKARHSCEGKFPSFDHRTADPIENDIQLSRSNKIVIVEGNYLLLNAEPWCRLKKEVFDETWCLDVSVQESNRRVVQRHMKIGLSAEQARTRVIDNDGMNAELVMNESPSNADRMIKIVQYV